MRSQSHRRKRKNLSNSLFTKVNPKRVRKDESSTKALLTKPKPLVEKSDTLLNPKEVPLDGKTIFTGKTFSMESKSFVVKNNLSFNKIHSKPELTEEISFSDEIVLSTQTQVFAVENCAFSELNPKLEYKVLPISELKHFITSQKSEIKASYEKIRNPAEPGGTTDKDYKVEHTTTGFWSILQNKLKKLKHSTEEIFNFVKSNKIWSLQVLTYASSLIYVVLDTYNQLVEEGEKSEYALARGAGAGLKLMLVPTVLAPVSRILTTKLGSFPWINQIIRTENKALTHKMIATAVGATAAIHSVSHFLNDPTKYFEQPGLTGMTMLASFAIPIVGAHVIGKSNIASNISYGTKVLRPHQIGATIFMGAYAFHTNDLRLLPMTALVGGAYLLDVAIQKKYSTQESAVNMMEIKEGTDMVLMKVKRPNTSNWNSYHSGQYARLKMPKSIDKQLEYAHPFTIVDVNKSDIEFVIKKAGPWTSRLVDFASNNKNLAKDSKIIISGPFGEGIDKFHQNKPFAFFVSGVGITPLLAYLNDSVHDTIPSPVVDLYIVEKTIAETELCLNALEKAVAKNVVKLNQVHIYLTRENEKNVKKLADNKLAKYPHLTFFTNHSQPCKISKPDNKEISINLHTGRPNFKKIISNLRVNSIYACGSGPVINEIETLALKTKKRFQSDKF